MTTTIAIDIDGVIYDIIDHIVDLELSTHYKGYRPSSWECWNEFKITKSEFFQFYTKCWEIAGKYPDKVLAYTHQHAKKLFDTLHKDGYRIAIITKRSRKDVHNTLNYLESMKLHYDTFTVITDTQHKTSEYFDVIIDDYPYNLPVYNNLNGPERLGILVDQQWNKDYKLKTGQVRIYNLLDAIPLIHSFAPIGLPPQHVN